MLKSNQDFSLIFHPKSICPIIAEYWVLSVQADSTHKA
jgi:hypothetical protein